MINKAFYILLSIFILSSNICLGAELQPYQFYPNADNSDKPNKPMKKQDTDPYSDFRKKATELQCDDLKWLENQYTQKLKDTSLDDKGHNYYQTLQAIVIGIESSKSCGR
jgi:hypothetical protein